MHDRPVHAIVELDCGERDGAAGSRPASAIRLLAAAGSSAPLNSSASVSAPFATDHLTLALAVGELERDDRRDVLDRRQPGGVRIVAVERHEQAGRATGERDRDDVAARDARGWPRLRGRWCSATACGGAATPSRSG